MRVRTRRDHASYDSSSNGYAWWSLVCGLGAIAVAVMQPLHASGGAGFIATTIGIVAIGYGIQGLRMKRAGRATNGVAAVVGILFGCVGTLVMGVYVASFYLGAPNGSWTVKPGGELFQVEATQPDAAADAAAAAAAASAGAAGAETGPAETTSLAAPANQSDLDAVPIESALQLSAGSLAAALQQYASAGNPWPAALAVTTDNRSVLTPSGDVLGQLPRGAELAYQVAQDLTEYTLVLSDPESGGGVEFKSATGVMTQW